MILTLLYNSQICAIFFWYILKSNKKVISFHFLWFYWYCTWRVDLKCFLIFIPLHENYLMNNKKRLFKRCVVYAVCAEDSLCGVCCVCGERSMRDQWCMRRMLNSVSVVDTMNDICRSLIYADSKSFYALNTFKNIFIVSIKTLHRDHKEIKQ